MTNDPVRILVIAKLADRTLDGYLLPIVSMEGVSVHVVRSTPGLARNGVTYVCPPLAFRRSEALCFLWKVLASLRLGLNQRFSCVYAIFAYPHLYLASLVSFMARKPLYYSVIASDYEFIGRGPVLRRITNKLVRRVGKVMVSGKKAIHYLVEQGIPARDIVEYQQTGLADLSEFFPMGLDRPIDLIVVSRLVADKNIHVFVDIVDLVKESRPDVRAAIVGDGNLRRNLEDYVRDKGLSDNIHFHGWLSSPAAINRVLNSAKIFVLNSSHEGGPFTIPEAMAAGLCAVSSDVGEVRSLIDHGYNGFIVARYNDILSYVNIIIQLLDDPRKLSEVQHRASIIKQAQASGGLASFWAKTVACLRQNKSCE